jgi:hypothetical protein
MTGLGLERSIFKALSHLTLRECDEIRISWYSH